MAKVSEILKKRKAEIIETIKIRQNTSASWIRRFIGCRLFKIFYECFPYENMKYNIWENIFDILNILRELTQRVSKHWAILCFKTSHHKQLSNSCVMIRTLNLLTNNWCVIYLKWLHMTYWIKLSSVIYAT